MTREIVRTCLLVRRASSDLSCPKSVFPKRHCKQKNCDVDLLLNIIYEYCIFKLKPVYSENRVCKYESHECVLFLVFGKCVFKHMETLPNGTMFQSKKGNEFIEISNTV